MLRYHDPANWPLLRTALKEMGKGHLIGNGPKCLVPFESRNELKGSEQREFAKRSANKAYAKGKQAQTPKYQKGLTRFSDNQAHNEVTAADNSKPANKRRKPKAKQH
jgi:hypothetical protein